MANAETRKVLRPATPCGPEAFLARYKAVLVMVSGGAAGTEYELDRPELILGRGPGVEVTFDDDTMSRAHAAFDLTEDGFRIRDLASTNGVLLNGKPVQMAELKHGDRIELGAHVFQYIVEERAAEANTYVIPEE